MEPGYDPLRAQYRLLTTPALLELEREGGLTTAALSALRDELALRDDRPIDAPAAPPVMPASGLSLPPEEAYGKLAPRGARLLARMIDFVVPYAILFGPIWLLDAVFRDAEELPGPEAFWTLAVALLLVASIAYGALADALPGGQSVGKRLLAIRVVDERTGAPCSYWQSFVRNLVLGSASVVDVLFIFGQRRQRLGDLAAHTLVVNKPSNIWAD